MTVHFGIIRSLGFVQLSVSDFYLQLGTIDKVQRMILSVLAYFVQLS